MTPSRIGPYAIEKKIGAGGMGTVYRGRHTESDRIAAVKVLPTSMAREEGFVLRFTREIDSLKKVANEHIVQLFESGVDDGTYYYAMEYVDGETLTAWLRREKRLPWPEVIELTLQICSALKAAHDAGIIHRDLKPSNLMLTADKTVKLTDFGVAQVFAGGKLTVTGGIIGTAEYMSPEQAEGKRATKVSDLYSLGAVMYVMLTGRPPFQGKSTVDVIQKQKYGQFDKPSRYVPEIPHWLEEIVCQLLEKDPEKRFPDAYVLSLRLKEVANKVRLSSQEQTVAAGNASAEASAPTVSATANPADVSGTLMRDLLRAEIEEAQKPALVAKILDNTWVLLAILILIVFGGVAFFGPGDDGSELQTVDSPMTRSDVDRFLDLSKHHQRLGDYGRAERILVTLRTLLHTDAQRKKDHDRVEQRLKLLRRRRGAELASDSLINTSMQRAQRLSEGGETEMARKIWSAVVDLYGEDPHAREFVENARTQLEASRTLAP